MLYKEDRTAGRAYREGQLEEVKQLIAKRRADSRAVREAFFRPDFLSEAAYDQSVAGYRRQFYDMLGWPLNGLAPQRETPKAERIFVAEDGAARIERLLIEVMPGVTMYGILFTPLGGGVRPLVISQHGGGGTPELCSSFLDDTAANYNRMTRRVLDRGYAVFAPQMHLWSDEFGPPNDRLTYDRQLKQLGGSITALELFKLMRALDYLTAQPDIDPSRVGMIGLSYGGFYALFAAATDPRIRCAVSSCFFSDRYLYDWFDWTWFDAGNTFTDAEICALVCPRALYVEVGDRDELFGVEAARRVAPDAARYYEALGVADRFVFSAFPGLHELSKTDDCIDFLCAHV